MTCQVSNQPAFRRGEPDARRQSLIEACTRVLARSGAAGASVRSIALEAGVSAGLVTHYFGGIDALVAATYDAVGSTVDAALDRALAEAGPDPLARLEAYLTASFRAPIADPALLATWIAFWSLTTARSEIAARHDAQYGAFRTRLEGLLADCDVPAERRRLGAIALTALVDGLWLELCLSPDAFTGAEAAAMARAQLAALLPEGASQLAGGGALQ
jgi:AcrR family transcriptional regulator